MTRQAVPEAKGQWELGRGEGGGEGHVRVDSTSSLASLSPELRAPRNVGGKRAVEAAADNDVPSAFSMESLLRDSMADKERKARLQQQQHVDLTNSQPAAEGTIDEDDEYLQEMLEQERLDALVAVWHFYDLDFVIESHPFPSTDLPEWLKDLQSETLRGPIIMSGLLSSVKSLGLTVPEHVLSWLLYECMSAKDAANVVCSEQNETLAYAYFNVLEVRISVCLLTGTMPIM